MCGVRVWLGNPSHFAITGVMGMNLFIIGNGFDLYHDLPTRYEDFAKYMKDSFPQEYGWLYDSIQRYSVDYEAFLGKGDDAVVWNDMENVLGSFEPLALTEEHRDWNSPVDYDGPPSVEIQQLLNFGLHIGEYLAGWLECLEEDIQKAHAKAWIVRLLGEGTPSILSFNYTLTLEWLYGKEALHIHGKRDGKLIMGHGNKSGGDVIGDDFGINRQNQKYVNGYFLKTYKDTEKVIAAYPDFFSRAHLKNITDIYVLGHSLNQIDLPYFAEISKQAGNRVKWHIVYYDDIGKDEYQKRVDRIVAEKDCCELLTWDALAERFGGGGSGG